MAFGGQLDTLIDSMEETRFRKKHVDLINNLVKKLHFDYNELECILLIYYKIQKDGAPKQPGVTKVQFRDVLHCCFDMTNDFLMDRVFLAIDPMPSQYISMEKWACALSLFLRGSFQEKIDFCFNCYNLMGDGLIGRDTVFHFLRTSMQSLSGEEDAEESAKDMIEVMTKKMDLDRDGKISYNDYKQSVLNQPQLLECMGQCLPSRQAVYAFVTSFNHKTVKM